MAFIKLTAEDRREIWVNTATISCFQWASLVPECLKTYMEFIGGETGKYRETPEQIMQSIKEASR